MLTSNVRVRVCVCASRYSCRCDNTACNVLIELRRQLSKSITKCTLCAFVLHARTDAYTEICHASSAFNCCGKVYLRRFPDSERALTTQPVIR
eukprot:9138122-Pyramimonas_sp.AAC.1